VHSPVSELTRAPLSLISRLRLVFTGHEDFAGIVFWAALVGFTGALASVAFRESTRALEFLFTGQANGLVLAASGLVWWHRLLVPIIGGCIAGLILYWGGRALTAKRAIDYMEAVLVGDGRIGFRSTLISSIASLFTIASGGSIGREGPMVQLAAMLGSKLGALARAPVPRLRLMVACGGAAGIASAYNAPISGALFVSEIVLGSIAMESFGPLVVSSVIASATIHRLLGYGPVFDVPRVHFASNIELVFFLLLGVLLGHLAPPFLALLDFVKSRFVRLHLPAYWQLGLGGLSVGVISIFVPQVWGNGYSVVGDILQGRILGMWLFAVLAAKVLATSATVGSGAVGGVLTPTLFIGCAVGALVGTGLHDLLPTIASVPAAYALIGMGGFLAATTHAPLTSILMIFEMTADYDIVLPLMLACVSGHYTAKVYRRGESVYHAALTRTDYERGEDDWRLRTVEALVKPAAAVVSRSTTLAKMVEQLPARPIERAYVTDGDDLIAWVDPRQILERMQKGELSGDQPVGLVANAVTFVLTPDMSLCAALDGFLRERATVLPVTTGQWRSALVGEVARHDVLLAIQDRLTYPK
jgi:CIC family chloride channel protein